MYRKKKIWLKSLNILIDINMPATINDRISGMSSRQLSQYQSIERLYHEPFSYIAFHVFHVSFLIIKIGKFSPSHYLFISFSWLLMKNCTTLRANILFEQLIQQITELQKFLSQVLTWSLDTDLNKTFKLPAK